MRKLIRNSLPKTSINRLSEGINIKLSMDQYIDNHIYWFGEFEPDVGNYLKLNIKIGAKCIDIGGHIGYFTLLMSQLCGSTGKVYTFEPEPCNFAALKYNLDLNNVNNVVPIEAALTNQETLIDFLLAKTDDKYGSAVHSCFQTDHTSNNVIKVKSMTWDKFAKNSNITKIDFIKIDCEGGEILVLEGMCDLLKHSKATLIIEVSPPYLAMQGKSVQELKAFLESFGYQGYKLFKNGVVKKCRMDNIDHSANMVFLPN